jgi:hypothetical protein
MKKLELEKFIQNLSTELYSFAFILIPDDLQATQLMIDSVSSFLILKKAMINRWSSFTEKEILENSTDIKIHLYKSMYELSKKRYGQLSMSFKDFVDNSGFFSLEFDDKAALFLKERTAFPLDVIEFILGQTKNEVVAHLYSARQHLIETTTKDI